MGDTNESDVVKDKRLACDYAAKVAFALKLGYNEELLNSALAYLGPCPSQNELLAELVKLGDLNKTTIESEYNHFDLDTKRRPEYDLRPIVVDGSNVAMSHGNGEYFSCKGIKICVEWFRNRGHNDITVFVPKWRKEKYSKDNPIKDSEILQELERDRLLVFTPSKFIGGKRVICYDDRYILKLATETDGVVVSNDNYRDLVQESVEFKKVVEERVLMFSFVNDLFMPPDDPLGRLGPNLDIFLRIPRQHMNESLSICPYGKKCTYGIKCKFYHPKICLGQGRGGVGGDKGELQQKFNKNGMRRLTPVGKSQSLPLTISEQQYSAKVKLCRAKSNCSEKLPLQRRPAKQLSKSNVFQEPPSGSMLQHELSSSICTKLHSNSEVNTSAEMMWSSLANISLSTEREHNNHHNKLQRRSSNKSQQSVKMKSPLQ